MKSRAPRLMDSTARSMLPHAVITITGRRESILLNARQQIETLLAGGGVARVVQVDQQHIVVALAQRLQQQLRRAHAIHLNALRRQQQLDGFENVRLIVGNQNANSFLLTWNGPPPLRPPWRRRLKFRTPPEPTPVARRTSMRAFSYAVSAVTSADSARARSCSAASVCWFDPAPSFCSCLHNIQCLLRQGRVPCAPHPRGWRPAPAHSARCAPQCECASSALQGTPATAGTRVRSGTGRPWRCDCATERSAAIPPGTPARNSSTRSPPLRR